MDERLVGRGIYDATEAAHLLRVHPDTLGRWTLRHKGHPPIVSPTFGDVLSFHDLVSLLVVAELWGRGVPMDDIRLGTADLARRFTTATPLAEERVIQELSTVGRGFFAGDIDVGKGGQGAFREVIEPLIRRLEFDAAGLANIWRPREGIWLNPGVQAGAPCLDGTRIPTDTIVGLAKQGEDPTDIADDYDLDLDQVLTALAFEEELVGAGAAAG